MGSCINFPNKIRGLIWQKLTSHLLLFSLELLLTLFIDLLKSESFFLLLSHVKIFLFSFRSQGVPFLGSFTQKQSGLKCAACSLSYQLFLDNFLVLLHEHCKSTLWFFNFGIGSGCYILVDLRFILFLLFLVLLEVMGVDFIEINIFRHCNY